MRSGGGGGGIPTFQSPVYSTSKLDVMIRYRYAFIIPRVPLFKVEYQEERLGLRKHLKMTDLPKQNV